MENKKETKQNIYWCQCFDVNQRLSKINIGKSITKDTGMVCRECGYKIFEEKIIDEKTFSK